MPGASGKKQVQDRAICLARRDFSESSLVLVLLCRVYGKVSVLAKGARRPKSPLAIDLLDSGQATLIIHPEGMGLLTTFAADRPLPQLRADLDKLNVSLYIAEIINLATKELAPAEELFDLLTRSLEEVARTESRRELGTLLVRSATKVLSWAGYEPQLQRCVNCSRVMGPTDRLFFTPSGGGLLCRDCEPAVVDKIGIENRAWYYLIGKVHDPISAGKAFDVINAMLREHLYRSPRMYPHCRKLFSPDPDTARQSGRDVPQPRNNQE
ncbi:MAG: DNA repair protein RecO [Phycisphaerae bacterium]|nr:DNA repair protein RecO [Phycisphaerae bacterium]